MDRAGVQRGARCGVQRVVAQGVRGGFGPAFAVQAGSLAGDAVWAVLGLAGVGALFAVPVLRVPLTVAGCVLLAWLGLTGLRDAAFPGPAPRRRGRSRVGGPAGVRSRSAPPCRWAIPGTSCTGRGRPGRSGPCWVRTRGPGAWLCSSPGS
ncbi:LysE family transporter [Nonomuraea rubra]|uniref:LysE family transporter n=1 Tax=Nonomuraea rubra TaxID=46180 RepID=UPI0036077AFA